MASVVCPECQLALTQADDEHLCYTTLLQARVKDYDTCNATFKQYLKTFRKNILSAEARQALEDEVQADLQRTQLEVILGQPKKARRVTMHAILISNHSPFSIDVMPTDDAILRTMFAYTEAGDRIYLIKSLAIDPTQRVFLGYTIPASEAVSLAADYQLPAWALPTADRSPALRYYEPERLKVIKWIGGPARPADNMYGLEKEMQAWERLKGLVPDPGTQFHYRFWDNKVMVQDFLIPLRKEDYKQVGRQLLPVLKKMHRIALHSDIKPDNILKDANGTYYLMDMGGITFDRLAYGFDRLVFSPHWTSQVEDKQISTYKNDLLELGYTLHWLAQEERGRHKMYKPAIDGCKECWSRQEANHNRLRIPNFPWTKSIRAYMDRVYLLDERVRDEAVYDELAALFTS